MKDQETAGRKTGITRRGFLRGSALAAAGVALSGGFAAGQVLGDRPRRKIRLGVVGGNFGATFQWHEHPDCIVAAVSDLRPERRERLTKVYKCNKTYESLEKLILDKEIDAVAIFTGAPDHVRHSVMALKAGKHVCCAVPAAMNLEEAEELLETVKSTGLTYMMAETSYYRQPAITVRKLYNEGAFGTIFYTEAEYHHPGIEKLWFENGKPTWRHGLPTMLYPTHCTAFVTGITGERLVEVTCLGWGNDDPIIRNNAYHCNFWNTVALFKTNRGNALRVGRIRRGGVQGCERADWYGEKMSFFMSHPVRKGPFILRPSLESSKDDAGFIQTEAKIEEHQQVEWWKTEMLPEPLRHPSGHDGSHTFLTHEFIDALVHERKPAIDIYEALAYTVPGIIAHASCMQGGRQMKIPSFDPKK